ncbi:MAG TPA: S8 family serine peptidase, partial [Gammaproteobacteria bacterium]|nr:S8 family serine peptidase [Gammaproteobacteria bacterium]
MPVIQPGPDPLLELQWHLLDSGQAGAARAALNVTPVWNSCEDASCRGEGVRIAVVDDGLEIGHPDLWPNIVPGASYNYLTGSLNPSPRATGQDSHGTAVAGLAAARDFNSEGGRGVAPRAGLVGYNLLQNPTLANEADAMTRGRALMAISTNSWGAPDGLGRLQPSNLSWRSAIETGLSEGRGGRGIVYTWAAGNGHWIDTIDGQDFARDNANYDGRANYYGVLAIGAVDHRGIKARYSEEGANLWLVAPGGNGGCDNGLVTTDLSGAAGLNDGRRAG